MTQTSIALNKQNANPWGHIKPEDILDWYFPLNDPLAGRAVVGLGFVELNDMPQVEEFVEMLYSEVEKRPLTEIDFNLRLDWPPKGEKSLRRRIKFRAHRQESIEGPFVILRQMPVTLPQLELLGLPDPICTVLMHDNLNKGGMVVICGEPGNGKSTTTAATIRARLQKFGGFCLTLENPVEMPLHGRHGQGFCLQSPVHEGGFENALTAAMRCYPTATNAILYLGEVRSAETAAEALRIANNGHLVLTTLHSSNVMTALKRILSLAKTKHMTDEESCSLLASSLRLVIHQKLEGEAMDPTSRKLKTSFLLSANNQSPVANRIRGSSIDNLVTEVEQQNQMLRNNQIARLLEGWKMDTLFG
jgi:Tfp pilus assembly pilus retraction ATPase PilT